MPGLQELTGSVSVRGRVAGVVTRGPLPWEDPKAVLPPGALARGPVKRPHPGWRRKNRWRMFRTGEAFVPALLAVLAFLKSLRGSRVAPLRWVGNVFSGVTVMTSELRAFVTHADGSVTDYGVVSRHVVTTAGKNYLAACFPNTNEPENFKYHGYGTGTTAAAVGDTALQTELTTQYNPDSTRPTGSQSSSTNTYTTAGTLTPDSGGTIAVTEHGIFTATSAGTLLDRNVFSAINIVGGSGDSLTTTYTLTIS